MNKTIIMLSIVLLIATAVSYGITRNDSDNNNILLNNIKLDPVVYIANPNFSSHHSAIEINLTSGWLNNYTGLRQIKLINENVTVCLNLTTFDRIECLK